MQTDEELHNLLVNSIAMVAEARANQNKDECAAYRWGALQGEVDALIEIDILRELIAARQKERT